MDIGHSLLDIGYLHVLHSIRKIIKSRMAVNLVVGRIKKRLWVFCGGMDMGRLDDPDADTFIATAIYVSGIFERHLSVGGMETSNVFVAKPLFGAEEYFPEWPVFHGQIKVV